MRKRDFPRGRLLSRSWLLVTAILLSLFIAGCGDNHGENEESLDLYSLSGDVVVSAGQFDEGELVLRNEENGDVVTIDWSGDSYAFEFPQRLEDGEDYHIVVVGEPPQWDCSPLSNTQGTIDGEDVDDIEIECYSGF